MCTHTGTKIKLFIPAGGAAATPPFGPILGQYGINTVQFCKEYNENTGALNMFFDGLAGDAATGFVLVVDIYIKDDRTYSYVVNKPPVSYMLRLLTGVKVGSPRIIAGTIRATELVFMSQFKFPSMPLPSAVKMLAGTARSIGIRIVK